jgi:16S rRNA (uracil1498-N3)-methyltransferase
MRIDRFFTHQPLQLGIVTVNDDLFHHIVVVLRKKVGFALVLFDGTGFDYSGVIVDINKKSCTVNLTDKIKIQNESPLQTILAQSISKKQFDFILQKATELGVNEIYPLVSEFSNYSPADFNKKFAHFQQIIIASCEQSNRSRLPTLKPLTTFNDFICNCNSDIKVILHPYNGNPSKTQVQPQSISLLVGPEGGFSNNEVIEAVQYGFISKTFGKRILRTETATITALTYAQMQFGDFCD